MFLLSNCSRWIFPPHYSQDPLRPYRVGKQEIKCREKGMGRCHAWQSQTKKRCILFPSHAAALWVQGGSLHPSSLPLPGGSPGCCFPGEVTLLLWCPSPVGRISPGCQASDCLLLRVKWWEAGAGHPRQVLQIPRPLCHRARPGCGFALEPNHHYKGFFSPLHLPGV